MDIINIAHINDEECLITCAYIPPRLVKRFLKDMSGVIPFRYNVKTTLLTTIISLPMEYAEALRCYIDASYSIHDVHTNK